MTKQVWWPVGDDKANGGKEAYRMGDHRVTKKGPHGSHGE